MNTVDTLSRVGRRLIIAEGHLEHRSNGTVQTVERRKAIRLKGAVLCNAGSDERMCELHQNRARPPEHDHPFGVDLPGWAGWSRTHRFYTRIPHGFSPEATHAKATRQSIASAIPRSGVYLAASPNRSNARNSSTSALNVTLLED